MSDLRSVMIADLSMRKVNKKNRISQRMASAAADILDTLYSPEFFDKIGEL